MQTLRANRGLSEVFGHWNDGPPCLLVSNRGAGAKGQVHVPSDNQFPVFTFRIFAQRQTSVPDGVNALSCILGKLSTLLE